MKRDIHAIYRDTFPQHFDRRRDTDHWNDLIQKRSPRARLQNRMRKKSMYDTNTTTAFKQYQKLRENRINLEIQQTLHFFLSEQQIESNNKERDDE